MAIELHRGAQRTTECDKKPETERYAQKQTETPHTHIYTDREEDND